MNTKQDKSETIQEEANSRKPKKRVWIPKENYVKPLTLAQISIIQKDLIRQLSIKENKSSVDITNIVKLSSVLLHTLENIASTKVLNRLDKQERQR